MFYPGTLGEILGFFIRMFNVDYGIYVRGQMFGKSKFGIKFLKNAKFILTVSGELKNQLSLYNQNVEVIRPMISITQKDYYYRPSLTKIPKCIKLLFVGRVEERKGIFELLEVAKLLNTYGDKFSLKVIGGGELYRTMMAKQQKGQIPQNIEFTGQISQTDTLMQEYENADAFIFPSHDEGFPRTLYEAMSKSLPIFTTFVGGIKGVMIDNYNCIEIPVKNYNLQASIIHNGLLDIDKLNEIGNNGLSTLENVLQGKEEHSKLVIDKSRC